jgi:hypothetical protein
MTNVFIALKIAFMLSKTDVMVLWRDGAAVVVLGAAVVVVGAAVVVVGAAVVVLGAAVVCAVEATGLAFGFCPWTIEEKTLKNP